jgi:hypothetical protein
VRRAALALVTELDERVEDDLTEAILGRSIRLLTPGAASPFPRRLQTSALRRLQTSAGSVSHVSTDLESGGSAEL